MKQTNPDSVWEKGSHAEAPRPTIHIVIPVFNRLGKTRDCLNDLARQTWRKIVVWLIDDASTDETPVAIPRDYPWVRFRRTAGDRWWTGATNDGIRAALEVAGPEDRILLLNNDLRLPPDMLEKILGASVKAKQETLWGAVCLDRKDGRSIVDGGVRVVWATAKIIGRNQGKDIRTIPEGHEEEVSVLTGRGVLYPAEAFRRHGLFDERHFQQCGDYSLPALLKRKGYNLKVTYEARVFMDREETDLVNFNPSLRFRDWREVFFGVRSNHNLKYRFFLAWYGCPRWALPGFLVMDFLRVVGNFLKRCG